MDLAGRNRDEYLRNGILNALIGAEVEIREGTARQDSGSGNSQIGMDSQVVPTTGLEPVYHFQWPDLRISK